MGRRLAGFLLLLVFAVACGKKGPPIPPERLRPRAVTGTEVRNIAAGIELAWRAPTRRVNNAPLEDLRGFTVLRASGRTRAQCMAPDRTWTRIAAVEAVGRAAEHERFFLIDEDVTAERWYAYRVLAVDSSGNHGSPGSEIVILRAAVPKQAPAPEISVGDGFLTLQMPDLPEGVEGWHFYRSLGEAPFGPLPTYPGVITASRHTDAGLTNGQEYRYAATWLARQDGFLSEGPLSEAKTEVPRDLIPPPAPRTVVAVAAKAGVEIRWERVDEPDVRYHVYRRRESDLQFKQLTEEAVDDIAFHDKPQKGTWVYGVSAVDTAGNESALGAQAKVVVR